MSITYCSDCEYIEGVSPEHRRGCPQGARPLDPRCDWCGERTASLDGNWMCPPCAQEAERRWNEEQQEVTRQEAYIEERRRASGW